MPQIPDNIVHGRIARAISENIPLDVEYWKLSRKKAGSAELSLYSLYSTAYRRVSNGKHFFGCGSWYEYLRTFQNVNSLSPNNLPNERISSMITQQTERLLKAGDFSKLSSKQWQTAKQPVTSSGQSLAALNAIAQARKIGGKTFLSFGNWRSYLISLVPDVAKAMPLYNYHRRRATVTAEQINAEFRKAIKAGLSLRPVDWREHPTSSRSKIKPEYAALSRARSTLDSRRYLGHDSYPKYLKNEHGFKLPKTYLRRRAR
ncbi:MAG: hypothetical protein WCW13_02480 [archaeon]|jgi:hypothetical protein